MFVELAVGCVVLGFSVRNIERLSSTTEDSCSWCCIGIHEYTQSPSVINLHTISAAQMGNF
jgi:hypothetical protein